MIWQTINIDKCAQMHSIYILSCASMLTDTYKLSLARSVAEELPLQMGWGMISNANSHLYLFQLTREHRLHISRYPVWDEKSSSNSNVTALSTSHTNWYDLIGILWELLEPSCVYCILPVYSFARFARQLPPVNPLIPIDPPFWQNLTKKT